MEISNRVAVVTGAAGGIGHALCLALGQRGVQRIGMVDASEQLAQTAEQVDQEVGSPVAMPFQGDVTDATFRGQVFDAISAAADIPRICVPAAGITRDRLAVKVDKTSGKADSYAVATFREVLEVNLVAPTYWAMEMVARIAEERTARRAGRWKPAERVQGTAIFIGSVSSQGNKGQVAYAATKAGLEGVAATLSKESIFHGVRCGVIHPGFTDTPMVRALGQPFIEEHILPSTQLGRLIQPAEIADAICFMIANSAVSGTLWADAGWHPDAN